MLSRSGYGPGGRQWRRRVRTMRLRPGADAAIDATSLRINLDAIAAWPDDEDDYIYTSAIHRDPALPCPCKCGETISTRYCLDCDSAGLDGPMHFTRPDEPNRYPGLPVDYAADPGYKPDHAARYEPGPLAGGLGSRTRGKRPPN